MKQLAAEVSSIFGSVLKLKTEETKSMHNAVLKSHSGKHRLLVFSQPSRHEIIAMALEGMDEIVVGDRFFVEQEEFEIPVSARVLGHVFDATGRQIDAHSPVELKEVVRPLQHIHPSGKRYTETTSPEILETGIKAVDFFAPFVKGRKIGIVGGAGVGKTVLITEIMRNVSAKASGYSMFVGIGERIREAHELYENLAENNLLKNTTLYLGQMNEPALQRYLVGHTAASVAQYLRDTKKQDILCFVDNVYRFVQAGNELSVQLGEIPSEGGYQPGVFSQLANLQNQFDSNQNGFITSVQSIYVPADDVTDPAVVEIYQQLDSVIVLSREIMEQGILPAIDLLATSSSVITPELVGERHYLLINQVQRILQKYQSLRGVVSIIGEGELSIADRTDFHKAKRLIDFFAQNMFVMARLSGLPGEYVSREDTLSGVEEILTS